jgi:SAM-dependent methyltransferase
MKISFPDIRSILAFPTVYRSFSSIVGGHARTLHVEKYIRPRDGDRILDIGCGPGDILEFLPSVRYLGFDVNQRYIQKATKRFGDRGTFFCKKLSREIGKELSDFDIILATGILHHLDNDEALKLFELAQATLKPGGRLITWDGCYTKGQSLVERLILSTDRGRYVRTKDEYLALASQIFKNIKAHVYHDLLRIPYTIIIMECA